MNKFHLGKIFFLTLLAVFAAMSAFSQDEYVRIKANGAVLKGQYGEMKCPGGTMLKVKSKGDGTYEVSGEVFGMKIEGTVQSSDVEPLSTSSVKTEPKVTTETKPAESELKPINYLGKVINQDFVNFFYEKIKETYCLKNINSDELIQGKTPTIVDNIEKCKKLSNGDIVLLDGTVKIETSKFYIVGISDFNYSRQNQNVVVFKKKPDPDFQTKWEWRRGFRISAVSGSKKEIPNTESSEIELAEYKFDEISPEDTFLSIQKFAESLTAGKEYKIDCPNCGGKGDKNKLRCTMCGGKKQLEGKKALEKLLKQFKEPKKESK